MDNQQFMSAINQDDFAPNATPVITAEDIALGIYTSRLPNRDTLFQVKNLLATDDEESTPERVLLTVYLTGGEHPTRAIGRMYLTLEKYLRMERALALFDFELCYVVNGVRGGVVPKERLVHTIKLRGTSIYEHI